MNSASAPIFLEVVIARSLCGCAHVNNPSSTVNGRRQTKENGGLPWGPPSSVTSADHFGVALSSRAPGGSEFFAVPNNLSHTTPAKKASRTVSSLHHHQAN